MVERAKMSNGELLTAVKRCDLCPDLPLGPHPILQWSSTAPILIAGQAPGRLTHAKGIPFADQSGERLRDWLGVDSNTFYDPTCFAIVPMAFCYPGTGSGGDLPPPPICARTWRNKLVGRMSNVRLTVILGRYAAEWHTEYGRDTITNMVSRWRETMPDSVVLPHPSPRNRNWVSRNPWFEAELLGELRTQVRKIVGAVQTS